MKPFRCCSWVLAIALLSLVAAFPTGCSTPPPPPPKPAPEPEPEPEPEPPPPPPKCENLDEECKADDSTQARIAGIDYVFVPPAKWVYAQLEEVTITQTDDAGPVLVLASFKPEGLLYQVRKQQVAEIERLAAFVKITLPRHKIQLFRPDGTEEFEGLKLSMWQRAGAQRAEAPGPLLVFSAELEGERQLFGIGFVPDADASEADVAIMNALKSIRPKPASDSGEETDSGEKTDSGEETDSGEKTDASDEAESSSSGGG